MDPLKAFITSVNQASAAPNAVELVKQNRQVFLNTEVTKLAIEALKQGKEAEGDIKTLISSIHKNIQQLKLNEAALKEFGPKATPEGRSVKKWIEEIKLYTQHLQHVTKSLDRLVEKEAPKQSKFREFMDKLVDRFDAFIGDKSYQGKKSRIEAIKTTINFLKEQRGDLAKEPDIKKHVFEELAIIEKMLDSPVISLSPGKLKILEERMQIATSWYEKEPNDYDLDLNAPPPPVPEDLDLPPPLPARDHGEDESLYVDANSELESNYELSRVDSDVDLDESATVTEIDTEPLPLAVENLLKRIEDLTEKTKAERITMGMRVEIFREFDEIYKLFLNFAIPYRQENKGLDQLNKIETALEPLIKFRYDESWREKK